jgi:hypothetical protein
VSITSAPPARWCFFRSWRKTPSAVADEGSQDIASHRSQTVTDAVSSDGVEPPERWRSRPRAALRPRETPRCSRNRQLAVRRQRQHRPRHRRQRHHRRRRHPFRRQSCTRQRYRYPAHRSP